VSNVALLDTSRSSVPMDVAADAWLSEPWSRFEFGSYYLGDCNGDNLTDAGDLSAVPMEIFDSDGADPEDAAGGTFIGRGKGCDANGDTAIDAADVACTVLLIFGGVGACGP
jgi:hypothetical protein